MFTNCLWWEETELVPFLLSPFQNNQTIQKWFKPEIKWTADPINAEFFKAPVRVKSHEGFPSLATPN